MKWAQKNGVTGELKSLCDDEKVNQAILSQMTSYGKKLGLHSFEQVRVTLLDVALGVAPSVAFYVTFVVRDIVRDPRYGSWRDIHRETRYRTLA